MWLEEIRVLSEQEIGRAVTQVVSNGSVNNPPLKATIGEIPPEYTN